MYEISVISPVVPCDQTNYPDEARVAQERLFPPPEAVPGDKGVPVQQTLPFQGTIEERIFVLLSSTPPFPMLFLFGTAGKIGVVLVTLCGALFGLVWITESVFWILDHGIICLGIS